MDNACIDEGHFLLERPIQDRPYGQVDPTYRYASDQGGSREPHRGVEFQAPAGDKVLAAGDGLVDRVIRVGEKPEAGLGLGYGNMVILEHHFPQVDRPIYTVYAHLAQILVSPGEEVSTGEQVGAVGQTGEATGPHLHFEVRVGSDRQADTQNPELWLKPTDHPGKGLGVGIAGRIQKPDGTPVSIRNIVIQAVDSNTGLLTRPILYLDSYADASFHGDDLWRENFAVGDLPQARYRVAFQYQGRQMMVLTPAPAGKLVFVTITVPD